MASLLLYGVVAGVVCYYCLLVVVVAVVAVAVVVVAVVVYISLVLRTSNFE